MKTRLQRTSRLRHASRRDRKAFLLVLVLIVVAMAGLAALNFSNSMLTSHETSALSGSLLQARMCSESGIQAVRLYVSYDRLTRASMGGQWDNASQFQALNVMPDQDPRRRGNFTVISPSLDQSGYLTGLRYGLQNESAKINLNTLSQLDQLAAAGDLAAAAMGQGMASMGIGGGASGAGGGGTGGQNSSGQNSGGQNLGGQNSSGQNLGGQNSGSGQSSGAGGFSGMGQSANGGSTQLASGLAASTSGNLAQTLLMGLPGMTEDTADAILDWLDEDEEPRPLGAEFADYYQQLQPAYKPTNGQLQSVEQLLLVRGVTPMLLFGYDENRNGVLDSDEQTKMNMGIQPGMAPGQVAPPLDPNIAPPPPLGWAPYFTLHSQEKNVANDGLARVNVNSEDLQTLYSELQGAGLSDLQASFIVAYRMSGQPSPTASNPLALLMSAGASGAAGQQLPPPPPPVSQTQLISTLSSHLIAFQQGPRGGGGGDGGGRGGPGGGDGGGRGGPGPAPGGGRGGDGGGRGGDNGGRGGRGDNGGRGGQGGGRGGGGMGVLQAAGSGGQGQGQAAPPEPWTTSAFASFDLTQQGGVQLNQLLDLVDATVVLNQNGTATTYTSPFTSSPLDLAMYTPILMDKLTTVDAKTIPGRINIMECPREILLGLPGITAEVGEQILEARIDGSESETRKYETWLACEGFVTIDQMRALLPLITCGGDVFNAQVIGYMEGSAAASRIEAIVSGAGAVPEVVFFRRLDHLGRGFDVATLGQRYDAAMNAGLGIQ